MWLGQQKGPASAHNISEERGIIEWKHNNFGILRTMREEKTRMEFITVYREERKWNHTAAAKSLQLCPTLCDPIDGSPPGSPIPGILQARTLEWVAISFSNACKWKVKVRSLSRVQHWVGSKKRIKKLRKSWLENCLCMQLVVGYERNLGLLLRNPGKSGPSRLSCDTED